VIRAHTHQYNSSGRGIGPSHISLPTQQTKEIHPFPQARFKPGIQGSERLQTNKLDRATTAISALIMYL